MVARETGAHDPPPDEEHGAEPTAERSPARKAAKRTATERAAKKTTAAPTGGAPDPERAAAKRTARKRTAAGASGGAAVDAGSSKRSTARAEMRRKSAAAAPPEGADGDGGAERPGRRRSASGGNGTDSAAEVAEMTGATPVVAKKTRGTATKPTTTSTAPPRASGAQPPVPKARPAALAPGELPVRPGEDPWTPDEAAEARALLTADALRLREEIDSAEASLAGLMRDSGDGAGDDQADTGTKNITREHELALTANARTMLEQTEHALERLDAGTYGLCENCGKPIGKARMQAFPRATLCVECKQRQERRG
ncbi:TraR/DksA C4-type zinc finger protein [Streptomyces sp. LE64]|uniref:TraR/DksA C4-type zinc finger protein n=1 Tax=Streptomyces sp. LE64 TaxID=3448653 RepID=UPI004042AB4B